eukprot:m.222546 g.222546  ORF g.222546 m.222546 type:complete len:771 (+) comp10784_c0_seq1:3-2315(+)
MSHTDENSTGWVCTRIFFEKMAVRKMSVGKCPTDALAVTNKVFAAPGFLPPDVKHIRLTPTSNIPYICTVDSAPEMKGDELGFNMMQRRWMNLSLKEVIDVVPYVPSPSAVVGQLVMDLDFLKKGTVNNTRFDSDDMARQFLATFANVMFAQQQPFVFEYVNEKEKSKAQFSVTVKKLVGIDLSLLGKKSSGSGELTEGLVVRETSLVFESENVGLSGSARGQSAKRSPINPNWNFQDMGIGGLDEEFGVMFRRAFASRVMPLEMVEKLGIKHVRGMLLFGPPGTGKTLMARQIGKMLQGREPKIVNGPEILNKYVGESEANIRKLFEDAEAEYKAKGENSSLHIIIFDEIDAICKSRGSVQSGTGVQDSVVNQLLSKIDGVNSLNNILLIGMTNRIDMLDEALLRPGRLELKIQIGLPNEQGRYQIYMIHTRKMRENKLMGADVDLKDLAARSKNFSGAEIEGLIRSAISFATHRCVKSTNVAEVDEKALMNLTVVRDDFENALAEVVPAFGVSSEELQECCKNGIVRWGAPVTRILRDGTLFVQQVQNSARTPLVSVLLHGAVGSGKTALAARLALDSGFPLIKIVTPERMVGYSEQSRCSEMAKVFEDAYKSPMSVVVVDDIERLLDYVPIGPRFSNTVLQTLLILLKKAPKQGRKLLIIGTTSNKAILQEMGMMDVFSASVHVENLSSGEQVIEALKSINVFNPEEIKQISGSLNGPTFKVEHLGDAVLSIGIKKLFMLAEMAAQETDDRVGKFMYSLFNECHGAV